MSCVSILSTRGVGQDLLGCRSPREGLAAVVPAFDEGADRGDELPDAVGSSAADRFGRRRRASRRGRTAARARPVRPDLTVQPPHFHMHDGCSHRVTLLRKASVVMLGAAAISLARGPAAACPGRLRPGREKSLGRTTRFSRGKRSCGRASSNLRSTRSSVGCPHPTESGSPTW